MGRQGIYVLYRADSNKRDFFPPSKIVEVAQRLGQFTSTCISPSAKPSAASFAQLNTARPNSNFLFFPNDQLLPFYCFSSLSPSIAFLFACQNSQRSLLCFTLACHDSLSMQHLRLQIASLTPYVLLISAFVSDPHCAPFPLLGISCNF